MLAMRSMATGRHGPRSDDLDGVRLARTGGGERASWLVAAAVGIVAFLAVSGLRSTLGQAPSDAGDRSTTGPVRGEAPRVAAARDVPAPAPSPGMDAPATVAAAPPAAHFTARRRQARVADPAPAAVPPPTPAGDAGTVSEPNPGIFVFPPPGTDPPKSGIVVPEGVELPPGYVRHYQSTDDGEQLEAILMFHPDYEFVDAAGRPITLPADRVVPPELAPAGIPIRMLVVPEPKGDQVGPAAPGRR